MKVLSHIWSAINPRTNQVEFGISNPTIEQQYWAKFKYCDSFRNFTLKYYFSSEKLGFTVMWTDYDDDLRRIYVQSEEAAKEVMNDLLSCACWADMQIMLDLYDFKTI